MEFTVKTVTSLGVDAGTMCWFTCDENLNETEVKANLSYLSKYHKKGRYNFYKQPMKDEETRVGKVCLIHEDYSDAYLHRHRKLEYVSSMGIQNNLLVSDPCYVCDYIIIQKPPTIEVYRVKYWGGGEKEFTTLLNTQKVHHSNEDENRTATFDSQDEFRQFYNNFVSRHPTLRVMIHPITGKLYDYVMEQKLDLVEYIDGNETLQYFCGTSTGYGDGCYELK